MNVFFYAFYVFTQPRVASGETKGSPLRSARKVRVSETLKVTVNNGKQHSTVAIIRQPEGTELGKGTPKMFTNTKTVPELYIIDRDKAAKSIVEIDESTTCIPLAIKTNTGGNELTFTMQGVEDISCNVSIFDALLGRTYEMIGDDDEYAFTNYDIALDNRFYLLLTQKSDNGDTTTGLNDTSNSAPVVYAGKNKTILIHSPAQAIESVQVYNLQGMLLYSQPVGSQYAYRIDSVFETGVYVVEVKIGSETYRTRVVIE